MRHEAVYRRRRAVAALLVVLVVILVVFAVRALLSGGDADAGHDGAAGHSTAKAPSTSDTPQQGTSSCDPKNLDLTISTSRAQFSLGSKVPFVVTVRYSGDQPCLVNVNDVSRAVVVTSGSDRIWSSADCTDDDDRMLLLAEGEQDRATVTWPMVRSVPKCASDLPDVRAGTYKAQVRLKNAKSKRAVFTLG